MKGKMCTCGGWVEEDALFCPHCGQRLEAQSAESPAQCESNVPQREGVVVVAQPSHEEPRPAIAQKRCDACRRVWEGDFKFCPECGSRTGDAAAPLKLVVHSPGAGVQEVLLDGSTVTLGTGPEATVRLKDPYASKEHCRFTHVGEGTYQLEDLGSSNGTFEKVAGCVPVMPGSAFLVGTCLVCVEKG